MLAIKKKYIIDEGNHKIAFQLDINTYNKIEEILENYALFKLMQEDSDDNRLSLDEAKEYYTKLKKSP